MPRKTRTPPTVAEMSKVINQFVYDLKPEEETKPTPTDDEIKARKAKLKAQKAAETKALNKKFDEELERLNNPEAWKWGDRLDLSTAVEVPSDEVKIVLSRIVKMK
jgi:hypothetical protein